MTGTEATLATPVAALAELYAGNQRFVTGAAIHPNQSAEHRATLAHAQAPFAVIFGCSDSRLAAEIIFDRGLGDLFVVRTAGHALGQEVVGSIEYAVTVLHTPLVVVLGHDSCGAVHAAHDAVRAARGVAAGGPRPSRHLRAVVDAIVPSVQFAAARQVQELNRIVEIHVQRTVDLLPRYSEALAEARDAGRCVVVGMSYQLSTGQVRVVSAR